MMHRQILGLAHNDPRNGDHKNGDKLDNRRSNLRIASSVENRQNVGIRKNNRSGYKGVSWSRVANKWHAYITVNWKKVHLGSFDNIIEAARAYDASALYHFGEFACLNFPEAS